MAQSRTTRVVEVNYFTVALIVLYAGASITYFVQDRTALGVLMLLYGACMYLVDRIGTQ